MKHYNDDLKLLEVEEGGRLKKPLTYKEVGRLADILEEELSNFFLKKDIFSKNIWINSLVFKDGIADLTVDSDYFEGRVGYKLSMNGDLISICPWADENFSRPFIVAYNRWVDETFMVHQHERVLER